MMTKIFNKPDRLIRFLGIEYIFPGIDPVRQDPKNVVNELSCCPDALDLFPAFYPLDRVVILEYIIV